MKKEIKSEFTISTLKKRINIAKLHKFLSKESYWAKGITIETVEKSIENSENFSVISKHNEFIGFARVITDKSTFAYLSDFYIDPDFQGKGIGTYLLNYIMDLSEFSNLRMWLLITKDAHEFYKKNGWKMPKNSEKFMEIKFPHT